jgi:hypothetical protein
MSIIRNIRIAMSADTKGFIKPVATVTSSLDRFNATANKTKSSLGGINFAAAGAKFGAGFAAIGAGITSLKALGGFFADGIKSATDLGETMSKTSQVFGDSTGEITAQADMLAKSFGLPKGAILDAASSFGLIGKGAGQSQVQAASMSKAMTQLAADASSFHNVPLDVALEKIRAGLTGESEPLKAFGVLMNEDAVKAEGLRLGLVKSGQEMNEQAKIAARASLIQKGLADASGDLSKTQGGVANQWRKLTGGLENFGTSIGELLLPALSEGVVMLNEFTASAVQAFEESKPLITEWVDWFKAGIAQVGVFIRNLGDYWELAKISATQQIANIVASFDAMVTNLGLVAGYVAGNWRELIIDGVTAIQTVFQNLGHNIGEYLFSAFHFLSTGEWVAPITKPLLEGFKATAAALPEFIKPAFVDMSAEMDAVLNKIEGKEKARVDAIAKGPAAAVAEKLGDLGGGAKAKDKKKGGKADTGAGAVELGSAEAASAVAKFRNQMPDDKPAKETALATKETAQHTKSTAQALREIAARTSNQAAGLGAFPM